MGVINRASALIVVITIGAAAAAAAHLSAAPQRTTRDRVYSRDQAVRGGRQYGQICARCHDPQQIVPGKKPGPILVGEAFLDQWKDRTIGELSTSIQTTMPSDGSVVLSPEETADLIAYLLQANGFPDGPAVLANDPASRATVISK